MQFVLHFAQRLLSVFRLMTDTPLIKTYFGFETIVLIHGINTISREWKNFSEGGTKWKMLAHINRNALPTGIEVN